MNSGFWRILAWIGVALQVISLIFVLFSEHWGGAWTTGGFLVLTLIFVGMKEHLPSLIDFLVVLAALLNAGGWAWNWYQNIVWFDEFIHFYTAFSMMSAIGYTAWRRDWVDADPGTGKFILWVAAVGLGLGIIWEILESLWLNLALGDTIVDLIMDAIGAAVAGWFVSWVIRKQAPHGAAATGRPVR